MVGVRCKPSATAAEECFLVWHLEEGPHLPHKWAGRFLVGSGEEEGERERGSCGCYGNDVAGGAWIAAVSEWVLQVSRLLLEELLLLWWWVESFDE